jgi:predicted nucleic acid-binding protein
MEFKVFDALHIACAEAGDTDILLTTDDRLLRKAAKPSHVLKVKLENPIIWLLEVTTNGDS